MDICYVGLCTPSPPFLGWQLSDFPLPSCSAPVLWDSGGVPIATLCWIYFSCPSRSSLHPALRPRTLAELKLVAEHSLGLNSASNALL